MKKIFLSFLLYCAFTTRAQYYNLPGDTIKKYEYASSTSGLNYSDFMRSSILYSGLVPIDTIKKYQFYAYTNGSGLNYSDYIRSAILYNKINGGGGSAGWSLLGNAGTNELINFIGTTDTANLNFKQNNVSVGKINTDSNVIYFGNLAGFHNSGQNNCGFGQNAARAGTGNNNIFLGVNSGYNSTGSLNVATGYYAGSSSSGGGLSAHGYYTGVANTGQYVTALGYGAVSNSNTSNYFIGMGYNAHSSGTHNNSIALGTNATTARANELFLSDSIFVFHAKLNNGASGTVLTTNGSGDATWLSIPTPTITSTYIGYGNGSNQLTGSLGFTYDGTDFTVKNSGGSFSSLGTFAGLSYLGDYLNLGDNNYISVDNSSDDITFKTLDKFIFSQSPTFVINTLQYNFPDTQIANTFIKNDGSGNLTWVPQGQIPQSVFTPTTAATVTVTANSYNVINPTGTIANLTIDLPNTPNDGDFIEVKFTQNVTAITWSLGSWTCRPLTAVKGNYFKAVYNSSNGVWY